ncbi:MAG: DNA polymerase IV [Methanomicrobiaceae archaeon]|nr:DNA polymerase IV [Methanomicrobiaceae archaeon]
MTLDIKQRIILHIDMDSFFASVEVREDEMLRNLPVIIGADPKGGIGRGVVSTCSYEARKYGIHSAMPVQIAYRLCPGAVFLPVNMPLYKEVSKSVMNIIKKYSDKFEQVSIDEGYLDLTHLSSFEAAEQVAKEIKKDIFDSEKITCSIGLAPSKVVSKIASDFKKPDGLTVVRPGNISSFLNPMPVGKIPGVGKRTQDILKTAGIITVKDLLEYDIQGLISLIGRHAADLKIYASGTDKREVLQRGFQKSIGRERTYQTDTRDREAIIATVEKICDEIKEKIASKKIHFKTITVKIRYAGFITHTKSVTLRHYTEDTEKLFSLAIKLINEYPEDKTPVRLVGVSVSNFESSKTIQKKIFDFT